MSKPSAIYLKDYAEPSYWISHVDLAFDLHPTATRVRSTMHLKRHANAAPGTPLILDGEHLKLLSVTLDEHIQSEADYTLTDTSLTLAMPEGESAVLVIETEISPKDNTALSGLYMSDGLYCTQCEAEGFRRITYYLDRPDVMATFTAKVVSNASEQPVLLSNGNCLETGAMEDGRHWAQWSDPFPKPAYLFALVAGDLGCLSDTFKTRSGRDIDLRIYAAPGKEANCAYAMDALKRSMTWDEERFGLEYDLDIFMIVAVNAFNAGAMENKGLNIFNDKYILVDPQSATDADYENVEGIVAHEYFHNWTGDRITCRDWFQLCLKEGLTVFRDQEFTSDMRSRAVKRVEDVMLLRRRQFAEDAGPLSHPPRPASFIEIDNFFTSTVYEKGAEVCGMIRTLVGGDGFRKGMDLYVKRHDGTAATVEQFVSAMADANGRDFSQFLRWYSQSGTPEVTITVDQDEAARTVDLHVRQVTSPTADQETKLPHHMPLKLGLVDNEGNDVVLQIAGEDDVQSATERVLELTDEQHTYRFENISNPVTPSVFRDFSAPVNVKLELTGDQRALLMGRDSNPFNRWETAHNFTMSILLKMVADLCAGTEAEVPAPYLEAVGALLADSDLDDDFKALMLSVPSELEIGQSSTIIQVDEIHQARNQLRGFISRRFSEQLRETYHQRVSNEPFSPDHISAGKRSLKNAALNLICANTSSDEIDLAMGQFNNSDNMTDTMAAMRILNQIDSPQREACLTEFYGQWSDNPIVIDKWFQTQAISNLPGTLQVVAKLTEDPAFSYTKPNKIYALIGAFAHGNFLQFHQDDGKAYEFLTDHILRLDKTNPEVSAGLMEAFSNWRQFDASRQALMKEQMERVTGQKSLSNNLFEIATKTLG